VFITPGASIDVRAAILLRPALSSWGLLLGHRRGHRVFVERLFSAGPGPVPPVGRLEELDRLFGRRTVGLYAVRPASSLKRAVLSPYFCGRIFLDIRPLKRGPNLKSFVVEFDGKFRLDPIKVGTGPRERTHE
jgi:hypothetical protein